MGKGFWRKDGIPMRVAAIFFSFVLVFGLTPISAFADPAGGGDDVTYEGSVLFSLSDDGSFVESDGAVSGVPIANVEVPLQAIADVDLADWGLEEYSYTDYNTDEPDPAAPTVLKLYLYMLEHYCGADEPKIVASGSPHSLYMTTFWGHDANLNYYVNGEYPLFEEGWGATADGVILKDGDFVDLAMFTDWDFFSDPDAGFQYFVKSGSDPADGKITHEYNAFVGEPLEVTLVRGFGDMNTGGATAYVPAEGIEIFTGAGIYENMSLAGSAGADGTLSVTFDEPGTYYVLADGSGVSSPTAAKVNVTAKPVAAIGDVTYGSLAEAVAAVPADGTQTTIKLLDNATGAGVVVNEGQNIVFDFNGKTYKVDKMVGSAGTERLGFQLLKGSQVTLKNGTLTFAENTWSVNAATGETVNPRDPKILVQNYSDLTLDGMVVTAAGTPASYAVSNNFGSMTAKGDTEIIAKEGGVAFDVWYGMSSDYSDGVTVTFSEDFTGTVTGAIEYGASSAADASQLAAKATLSIVEGCPGFFDVTYAETSTFDENGIAIAGGTFTNEIPENWLAPGYRAVQNSDNTWTTDYDIVIATESLPNAYAGKAYEGAIAIGRSANADAEPVPFEGATVYLAGGTILPAGLEIADDGTISGTPDQLGTFTFDAMGEYNLKLTSPKTLSITVLDTVTIDTESLPLAMVGQPYEATVEASGWSESYTFSLAEGSTLPAGLTLAADGTISGTPTEAFDSPVTFVATAPDGEIGQKALAFQSKTKYKALTGTVYFSISDEGDWVVSDGTISDVTMAYLPIDLAAVAATDLDEYGLGDFKYTARAADGTAATDASYLYEVTGLQLLVYVLENYSEDKGAAMIDYLIENGAPGQAYTNYIFGHDWNTITYLNGDTPVDIEMNASGDYSYTVTCAIDHMVLKPGDFMDISMFTSDGSKWSADFRYFTSPTDVNALVHTYGEQQTGEAFTVSVATPAAGWEPPITYEAAANQTVEWGKTLGQPMFSATTDETGKAEVTIYDEGTWYLWVKDLTFDENGKPDIQALPAYATVTGVGELVPVAPELITKELPIATLGEDYSAQLEITGYLPEYTYFNAAGELPPGLELSETGKLSGIPTEVGTYEIPVIITNDGGETIDTVKLVVDVPLTIATESIPNGFVGQTNTYQLEAIGVGSEDVTWSKVSGTGWITVSEDGVVTLKPTYTSNNANVTVKVTSNVTGKSVQQRFTLKGVYEYKQVKGTVYVSVSKDGEFVVSDGVVTGELMDYVAIDLAEVAKYDLDDYDLSFYKAAKQDDSAWNYEYEVTALQLMLYVIDNYYAGTLEGENAFGLGTWSAPGSLWVSAMWGMANPYFTYGLNGDILIDDNGYMPTADTVALKDGDEVCMNLYADSSWYGDSNTGDYYFFEGEAVQHELDAFTGDEYEFALLKVYSSIMDWTTYTMQSNREPAAAGLVVNYGTEYGVASGTAEVGADGVAAITFPTAGTWYVWFPGQAGVENPDSIVSAPAMVTVTVTDRAPATITTTTLAKGAEGVSYNAELAAEGNPAEFTWSLAEGSTLPQGLELSEAGVISGTAPAAGTYTFTVKATNGVGDPASQELTLTVVPRYNSNLEGTVYFSISADEAFIESDGEISGTTMWHVPVDLADLAKVNLADYDLEDFYLPAEDPNAEYAYEITALQLMVYMVENYSADQDIDVTSSSSPRHMFLTNYFGCDSSDFMYNFNGAYPWDETLDDEGATADAIVLANGDSLDVAWFSDSYFSMWYDNGIHEFRTATGDLTYDYVAEVGTPLTVYVTRTGIDYMTFDVGVTVPESGITGRTPQDAKTPYPVSFGREYGNATGEFTLDENGAGQVDFPQPGEWYVWLDGAYVDSMDFYESSPAMARVVVSGAPAVITAELPDATAYTDYSATLEAYTTSAVTWFVEDSTKIPAGLTLAADGTISGKATVTGDFEFDVFGVNAEGASETVTVKLTVLGDEPVIATESLEFAKVAEDYAATLEVTGLPTPEVTVTGLPEGMTFDAETLTISGMCATAGEYELTVTATNGLGSDEATLVLTVAEPPVVTTTTVNAGTVTVAFEGTLEATGTPAPQFFVTGEVPGLTFATDGTITGTPSAAGEFSIVVVARNTEGTSAVANVTVTVAPVDKSALEAALTAAAPIAADQTILTSEDGTDIWADDTYVTEAIRTALTDAIETGQTVLANADATQAEVDAAAQAITDAQTAFTGAITNGTKGIINLLPVNEESMYKTVNAFVWMHKSGTADLVFALSGTGYKFVIMAEVDEALTMSADGQHTGWIGFTSADVDCTYVQPTSSSDPTPVTKEEGVKSKYQFRVPITDEAALATLEAGEGSFTLPIVAVSDTRAKAAEEANPTAPDYTSAFTARQAVVDLDNAQLLTGNFKDTIEADVTSTITAVAVAQTGVINTVGAPNANEFTMTPTFTLSDTTIAGIFVGSATDAAEAEEGIITPDENGAVTLTFKNSRSSNTYQIDPETWKIAVALLVSENADLVEAGTWVDAFLTVDPEEAEIELSGNQLTGPLADGTYSIQVTSTLGMPSFDEPALAQTLVVKDGEATLVLSTGTYRFDGFAFASTDQINADDPTQLAEGVTAYKGSALYAEGKDATDGYSSASVAGYMFQIPLTHEQLMKLSAGEALQSDYIVKYVADPADIIKNHDNDWYAAKNQPVITIGTPALVSESTALPEATADYGAYHAAMASVPADLSLYTDESVAALNAAIAAVDGTKMAADQEAVDAMAKAVADAVAALALDPDKVAAAEVEAMIAELPAAADIDLDADAEDINAAAAAYDALTDAQKEYVSDEAAAKLQADVDKLAAMTAEKLIDNLPAPEDVTLADEEGIKAAAEYYDSLTDAQEALVSDAAKAKLAADLEALEKVLTPTIMRIAGENYANETAAAISSQGFEKSEWVIIARDDDYADALGAVGLAGVLNAPILLTDRYHLSDAAAAEIQRLGATKCYIIGGTGAIKDDVDIELGHVGIVTKPRLWGDNSYDTSLACAKEIVRLGGEDQEIITCMSTNFQDALSMSSYAYKYHVPIVLQTWGDTSAERGFTDEGKEWLAGKDVIVAGGPGAVSNQSLSELNIVERLWGDTGYDTSQAIADWMVEKGYLTPRAVVIACGAQAPKGVDALAGAALAGQMGCPMLLVSGNAEMEDVNLTTIEGFVTAHKSEIIRAYVLGGAYVVPQDVYNQVKDLIQAVDLSA